MKSISQFGEEVGVVSESAPAYRGNEAELTRAVVRYRVDGVVKEKPVLFRECLLGDKERHNAEIRDIYDRLRAANASLEASGNKRRIQFVKHYEDDEGNIYVKDLNPSGDIFVYDLLPDGYYLDDGEKPKSRFGEFKRNVAELKLNSPKIIDNLFEQLALVHAHGFAVGELVKGDLRVTHPTLSLFLCRLRNKKGENEPKIFIHDIHNLEPADPSDKSAHVRRCVRDIRDLSFDIIRYFRGVWLPYGGFRTYGQVIREIDPDFHAAMYGAFLWDPHIEVESCAMSIAKSDSGREKKESRQVLGRIAVEASEKDSVARKALRADGVFVLGSKVEKIRKFLETATPENAEFVIDFDGTLTSPNSRNALNAGQLANGDWGISPDSSEGFVFRRGALAFLRMLEASGFEVKIRSLGFKDVILAVLGRGGLEFPEDRVFANSFDSPVFEKSEIQIVLNPQKRQIVIGDQSADFQLPFPGENLKIGFVNDTKRLRMNADADFHYLPEAGDFFHLYHLFRTRFPKK